MKEKMLLVGILCLALGLRLYRYQYTFLFNHDQDLYSWIARDILVNHHLRSVGQITSVDGVFIGGLYYYLVAAVYMICGGNPASMALVVAILGTLTVYSFYWIGKKLYGYRIGLITAVIYATAAGHFFFDRWSVPTQPTILWSVWFLYVLIGLSRGWKKCWWLYGLLVGLIWHVHIALLPLIPLPGLAYMLGGGAKKWNQEDRKWMGIGLILALALVAPGIIFELKTNFSQTKSMLVASKVAVAGVPMGLAKFDKVVAACGIGIRKILWLFDDMILGKTIFYGMLFVWGLGLILTKGEKRKEMAWLGIWMVAVLVMQFWSKRPVSEYYFINIIAVVIMVMAILLDRILNPKLVYVALGLYCILNISAYAKNLDNNEALFYRLEVVEYIKNLVTERQYPCISINYIARFGDGVGFRYLFWWKGIKVVKPATGVANFDIVIPGSTSGGELNAQFGRFGIIDSKKKSENTNASLCEKKEMQLDPLLGYVE
jgi:4-amino-4-deoxy-L-arabinose transferase-like glycosyltransferase